MAINTDRIVSLSAMVIGISSLLLTFYQTYLTREAQHASALPYLMIAINSDNDGAFIVVRNGGLGPARIDDVRIHHRGKTFASDPYDYFLGVQPDRDSRGLSVDRLTPGRLIPAGESIRVLGMVGEERIRGLGDLLRLFDLADIPKNWLAETGASLEPGARAVIEIAYSSVYGDRWQVRSDQTAPIVR